MREVMTLNMKGQVIAYYESIRKAAQETKLSWATINNICRGLQADFTRDRQFTYRFVDDNRPINTNIGGKGRKPYRSIAMLDKTGKVVKTYKSAIEAGEDNFYSYQTITRYCRRKNQREYTPEGFTFRYIEEKKELNSEP